jgi:phosphate transport system substrate-binding protein
MHGLSPGRSLLMSLQMRMATLPFLALMIAGGCTQPSVKVDGSSTVGPVTQAVAEEFRKERPNVRVIVGISGTGGGFKKFSMGETDISDASRPIKDSEKEACAKNGVEYIELQVAFDGLAVLVNPQNDWCDCLTVEQLKAIWQPESAVNKWSDLNPDWPDEKFDLYGPGTDSGTFDYFTEAIMGEARSSRSDYTPSEDDNMLVTGIAEEKYALGYFGYAYYAENKDKLKLLGIDPGDGNCVKPSEQTVNDHSYHPLSRPLYIYVSKKSLQRPEVRAFVEYYLSNAAKLAPEVGYVAVPMDIAVNNQRVFDEATGESAGSM